MFYCLSETNTIIWTMYRCIYQCFQFGPVKIFSYIGEFIIHMFSPFPNNPWFLLVCSKVFENTVRKGEIAHNKQFLLFPQYFYPLGELSAIFIKLEIVICQHFHLPAFSPFSTMFSAILNMVHLCAVCKILKKNCCLVKSITLDYQVKKEIKKDGVPCYCYFCDFV